MATPPSVWIVHVDVDAFFASVEQLLIPRLRSQPVVVGSGCIASCSYEARRFGLHAGMSLVSARKRCPQAVVLAGHYPIYRCFAEHIWEICRQYCCSLETFLDEAYGEIGVADHTPAGQLFPVPDSQRIGVRLQQRILRDVRLPVSVGLARNRMMAKLASSAAKPGGVRVIPPGSEADYLAPLPVEKLLGVGRKHAQALREMNITTIGQVAEISPMAMRDMFGRHGETLHDRAQGRDPQRLRPDALPKTISRETTFHAPTCDRNEILGMLCYLLQRAMRAMRERKLLLGCVEASIRYDDWKQYATRRTLPEPVDTDDDVLPIVVALFDKLHRRRVALRHVGVVLSNFTPAAAVGRLFTPAPQQRREDLQHAIDIVRDRFGHGSMVTGKAIDLLGKLRQDDYGFVLRTPSLTK